MILRRGVSWGDSKKQWALEHCCRIDGHLNLQCG